MNRELRDNLKAHWNPALTWAGRLAYGLGIGFVATGDTVFMAIGGFAVGAGAGLGWLNIEEGG